MLEAGIAWLLAALALPQVGLSAVFVVAFVSATLLPMGSEPLVFAIVKANPELLWAALAVATAGNTLGGMIDYALGYAAKQSFARERESHWFAWLQKYGAKSMLLAWLPVLGDPLCTLAGWLKLPFWSCALYMAIGKFLRYLTLTHLLLYVPDGFWRNLAQMLG